MTPDIIIQRGKGAIPTKIELTEEQAKTIATDLLIGSTLDDKVTPQTTDKVAEIILALVTNPPIKKP